MNRLQQQEPNQLIHQWQNELSQRGYIENEGETLNFFQKMDLKKEEVKGRRRAVAASTVLRRTGVFSAVS